MFSANFLTLKHPQTRTVMSVAHMQKKSCSNIYFKILSHEFDYLVNICLLSKAVFLNLFSKICFETSLGMTITLQNKECCDTAHILGTIYLFICHTYKLTNVISTILCGFSWSHRNCMQYFDDCFYYSFYFHIVFLSIYAKFCVFRLNYVKSLLDIQFGFKKKIRSKITSIKTMNAKCCVK